MDGLLRNMTSIYITRGNKILLLFRQGGRVVNDVWVGSAGGHFEKNELNNARTCVLRELREEININEHMLKNIRMKYITLRRTKGEVRQNYYFFAEIEDDIDIELVSNEGLLQWFDINEMEKLSMPYSARYVISHYFKKGISTDDIYVGVADGDQVVFTVLADY